VIKYTQVIYSVEIGKNVTTHVICMEDSYHTLEMAVTHLLSFFIVIQDAFTGKLGQLFI